MPIVESKMPKFKSKMPTVADSVLEIRRKLARFESNMPTSHLHIRVKC